MRRFLALVLLAGSVAVLSVPAQAATSLAVLSSVLDVRPGLPTPTGTSTAAISVARNEFESFQVVVEPDTDLDDLQVGLVGAVADGVGNTLPADSFTFYREGYATIVSNGASLDTRTDSESSAGQWPDVLIPETDYVFDEDRAAFHASVAAGGRVVVWVDVLAPLGQSAGTYTGTLAVRDGATTVGTVPLDIAVRDATIPSTSTLRNAFFTFYRRPCDAHVGHFACNWDDDLAFRLHALYARVALENRVTIANPWPVAKNQTLTSNSFGVNLTNRFRTHILPLLDGSAIPAEDGSPLRLPGAELTTLALYGPGDGETTDQGCNTGCVNAWKSEALTDGVLDRLVYYTCDEPFLNAARWDACNANHAAVGGPSGLPELVTSPIQQAHQASLGDHAENWIDVMVPLTKQLSNKSGQQYHVGNQRPAYDDWLAADGNRELWLYSACDAGGCNGRSSTDQDPPWNDAYWDGWGGYAIDAPATQARSMSWLAFEYDATGELYWHTSWKLQQAWSDCTVVNADQSSDCLYDSGMFGDGTLFYPGKACAPTPADRACIGGSDDIPLESIRLKRIRDGREDYEYLNLLAHASPDDAAFARQTALDLFGPDLDHATYSTTVSAAALEAARAALGDRIEGLDTTPAVTYQVDSAVRRGSKVWKGTDLHNRTTEGQLAKGKVKRGKALRFTVRVRNAGTGTDSYSIIGVPSGASFKVRYVVGGADVTKKVVAGAWLTGDLEVGEQVQVLVKVRAKKTAVVGRTRTWKVSAVSYRSNHEQATDLRDVVGIRVKVRR